MPGIFFLNYFNRNLCKNSGRCPLTCSWKNLWEIFEWRSQNNSRTSLCKKKKSWGNLWNNSGKASEKSREEPEEFLMEL